MKREDDQELWDLLGKTGQPPALSPFFARNVVRQVRQKRDWRDALFVWLRPRRLVPTAAVAIALVITSLSIHPPKAEVSPDDPPDTVAKIDPQDYEVVAELDDLLASEDDSIWSGSESLSL
jgi:hypothetical protein